MNWHRHFPRGATTRNAAKSTIALAGVCLLLVVVSSLPASAGIVNMQFTGVSGGHSYAGVYTYPYDIKVNGGSNQWMMCIGYNEHISAGETWKATVFNVGSLDPNIFLVDYEAAFLFKMAEADHGAHPEINAAAWWLLEGSPTSLSSSASSLVSLAQSQTYSHGQYSDVLLYKAIPGSESGHLGTAQDFLGATPEPGTLALFGSGILGLGGLLRRRLRG